MTQSSCLPVFSFSALRFSTSSRAVTGPSQRIIHVANSELNFIWVDSSIVAYITELHPTTIRLQVPEN